MRIIRISSLASLAMVTALGAGCTSEHSTGPSRSFLSGTATNPQIGIVVNSTANTLTLFQLGDPTNQRQIALGASSTISAVGVSVDGPVAVVPLGDASSVDLIDLQAGSVSRTFLFRSGNATGQAFVNPSTVLAANTTNGYVGRFTVTQASDTISDTVVVPPSPTDIEMVNDTVAAVICSNLDQNYTPIGNGIVAFINVNTMQVIDTVVTGGTNSTAAAVDTTGMLYVVNTGDYVNPSSVTIINPNTASVVTTIPNVGVGAGGIDITGHLAYISSYSNGTVIWNTTTQTFVRSPTNALCVMVSGSCLNAFDARPDSAGDVYQLFFGTQTQAPYAYVYQAGTYALTDSISVGTGPTALRIVKF